MITLRPNGEKPQVEVSKYVATPEELAEHHDYVARWERLQAMRPELMQKYPDQRVALTKGRALVVAPSNEELVAKIAELGERPGSAATLFLNTKPRRMLGRQTMIISENHQERPQVTYSKHKATPEELAEWRESEERWGPAARNAPGADSEVPGQVRRHH